MIQSVYILFVSSDKDIFQKTDDFVYQVVVGDVVQGHFLDKLPESVCFSAFSFFAVSHLGGKNLPRSRPQKARVNVLLNILKVGIQRSVPTRFSNIFC